MGTSPVIHIDEDGRGWRRSEADPSSFEVVEPGCEDCGHGNVHDGAETGCGGCSELSAIVRRARELPLLPLGDPRAAT